MVSIRTLYFNNRLYLMYAVITGIGNIYLSDSQIVALFFSIIQIAIIVYVFIRKGISDSVCFMLITVVLGLTNDSLKSSVGVWFSIKTLKLFGINMAFWLMIPFFVGAIFSKRIWAKLIYDKKSVLYGVVRKMIICMLLATILGFINVFLVNDNNIQGMNGYVFHFFERVYSQVAIVLIPIVILLWRAEEDAFFVDKLQKTLDSILVAMCVCSIISYLGNRILVKDDTKLVYVSVAGVFVVYMIIFPFFENYKQIKWWLLGICGVICGFLFFASGKMLLSLVVVIMLVLGLLTKRYNSKTRKRLIILVPIVLVVSMFFLLPKLTTPIVSYKVYQVTTVLNFFDDNWWSSMSNSPKWRIEEFLNIIKEYIEKPFYLFLGKGILGTIKDFDGFFQNSGSLNGANIDEYSVGLFYSLHETVNTIFITNGLFGLYTIFWSIKKIIRYYDVSPYVFIGIYWLVMFWGYSYTLAFFGIGSIVVGFSRIDEKRVKKESF